MASRIGLNTGVAPLQPAAARARSFTPSILQLILRLPSIERLEGVEQQPVFLQRLVHVWLGRRSNLAYRH